MADDENKDTTPGSPSSPVDPTEPGSTEDQSTEDAADYEPYDADPTEPEPTNDELAASGEAVGERRSTTPRPRRKGAEDEPVGKGHATRRRRDAEAGEGHRTGPVQFVGESVGELRKVVWPTRDQLQTYFWAVLVFVLFVIAYVGLLDLGLGTALLKIFAR